MTPTKQHSLKECRALCNVCFAVTYYSGEKSSYFQKCYVYQSRSDCGKLKDYSRVRYEGETYFCQAQTVKYGNMYFTMRPHGVAAYGDCKDWCWYSLGDEQVGQKQKTSMEECVIACAKDDDCFVANILIENKKPNKCYHVLHSNFDATDVSIGGITKEWWSFQKR